MDVEVPELVRQRARSSGSPGEKWLEELPGVLADLVDRWGLTLGSPFAGGTAGYVAEARDSQGAPCVLKIPMTLDEEDRAAFELSLLVQQHANGQACAKLLSLDTDAPAMLLERLGPNLADLEYPGAQNPRGGGHDTPVVLAARSS